MVSTTWAGTGAGMPSPVRSSTSGAITVIGPPVSMIAANRVDDPGDDTATTARSTGCGLRPRPSPKSVYTYCQASAKPVDHWSARCWCSHHLDVADVAHLDDVEELRQ